MSKILKDFLILLKLLFPWDFGFMTFFVALLLVGYYSHYDLFLDTASEVGISVDQGFGTLCGFFAFWFIFFLLRVIKVAVEMLTATTSEEVPE